MTNKYQKALNDINVMHDQEWIAKHAALVVNALTNIQKINEITQPGQYLRLPEAIDIISQINRLSKSP